MAIRKEIPSDIPIIYKLYEFAFEQANEAELVNQIRTGKSFIPDLSLVNQDDNQITGHILFSIIKIGEDDCLSLAPMAVLPSRQKQGIGSKLITRGLRIAKTMGFRSVIVVGDENYYPRFGFQKANKWGINFPFEVPEEAFMALELKEGALKGKCGKVVAYPVEFGI